MTGRSERREDVFACLFCFGSILCPCFRSLVTFFCSSMIRLLIIDTLREDEDGNHEGFNTGDRRGCDASQRSALPSKLETIGMSLCLYLPRQSLREG